MSNLNFEIARLRPMFSSRVILASVTPLASIFGSGFLIIVPVLERTLGALAVLGVIAVCSFAWFVGTAIRHNVATVEPLILDGRLDRFNQLTEWASDLVIVIAYVISVALYLRIMSQYVVELIVPGSESAERALASLAVVLIVGTGIFRGFRGLDRMERFALAAVLILTTVLGGVLFISDAASLAGGGFDLPPVPDRGIGEILLVLGGIVITVQGFETVRYLAAEYDQRTRILACRLSQIVSSSIYIGFVIVATPVMGLGTPDGVSDTLLDITRRVVPLLSIPIVVTAVLSQFSAATADTVAANGNFRAYFGKWMGRPGPYLLIGIASILLIWGVSTFAIIALASRAFAAYYALQCLIALRTSESIRAKIGFGFLAVVLAAITLLARPVG